jgi:hypothetical protein
LARRRCRSQAVPKPTSRGRRTSSYPAGIAREPGRSGVPPTTAFRVRTAPGDARLWEYPLTRRSASPNADNADIGNPLVDEVGATDPRWQLILEQLDTGDDLASRPRRPCRYPGEELVGDRRSIGWRERVEVGLGRFGQEDAPGRAERRREP